MGTSLLEQCLGFSSQKICQTFYNAREKKLHRRSYVKAFQICKDKMARFTYIVHWRSDSVFGTKTCAAESIVPSKLALPTWKCVSRNPTHFFPKNFPFSKKCLFDFLPSPHFRNLLKLSHYNYLSFLAWGQAGLVFTTTLRRLTPHMNQEPLWSQNM